MPVRSKTLFIVIVGSLMLLGIISAVVGFSIAAFTGAKPSEQPSVSPTAKPTTGAPLAAPATATVGMTATPSPEEPRPTSTPQPTFTVLATTPSKSVIIVRYGEALYPACRRNCAGVWFLNEVPPSLISYAQAVSRLNGIPWNNGQPLVFPGQRLTMPPCPAP